MTKDSFFQLPILMQWAAWLTIGLVGYLLFDQFHWWTIRDDYSFGFLAPVFVCFVIYDRWPKIRQLMGMSKDEPISPQALPSSGILIGLISVIATMAVVLGLSLLGFASVYRAAEGAATISSMMAAFGFAAALLGMVFLFSDRDAQGQPLSLHTRLSLTALFIFPAFIWLITAPTFSALEQKISTMLLNKVIFVVFGIYDFLGLDIIRQGSVLVLPKGSVGVEDACSGIRSLTASLFVGSFVAAVFFESWFKKITLVIAAACLAFFGNICRSLFLTTWAYRYGSDSIEGKVHDITGYSVMGVTIVGLIGLVYLFNFKLEYDDPNIPKEKPPVDSTK